jgi:flavin reductase (DIM6/NTAB) family NADH-FMN oxidoreductase RutF
MTIPTTTVRLADAVRTGLARCPASVFVVTSRAADGTPVGATATSVTSVSLVPPQLLVCLASTSATLGGVLASGRLAVHALAAGQERVAQQFATAGRAKFRGVPWIWSRDATPLLPDVLVRLECLVSQTLTVADHVVVVGDVVAVEQCPGSEVLVRVGHRFG